MRRTVGHDPSALPLAPTHWHPLPPHGLEGQVPSSRGASKCFLRCRHLTASSLRWLRKAGLLNVLEMNIFSVRQRSQWRPPFLYGSAFARIVHSIFGCGLRPAFKMWLETVVSELLESFLKDPLCLYHSLLKSMVLPIYFFSSPSVTVAS